MIKVVIEMQGGLIQQVISNEPVEVIILDRDDANPGEDQVSTVLNGDAYVMVHTAEIDKELVQTVSKEINSAAIQS